MSKISVKMVGDKTKVIYHQVIENFGSLGKEVKISPKAHVCLNEAGYKQEMFTESVTVTIGIGKDHVADLIMQKDAWEALKAGEPVSVTTTKEFVENFL